MDAARPSRQEFQRCDRAYVEGLQLLKKAIEKKQSMIHDADALDDLRIMHDNLETLVTHAHHSFGDVKATSTASQGAQATAAMSHTKLAEPTKPTKLAEPFKSTNHARPTKPTSSTRPT